jgi:hypothetical protein
MTIPEFELKYFLDCIHTHPEYLDPTKVQKSYCSLQLDILPDPFSHLIISKIRKNLQQRKPLSVIRIGDGEANILSFSHYFLTPNLNQYAFKKICAMQQDTFKLTKTTMICLQELLFSSLLQADIIGVIGLWRAGSPTTKDLETLFINDHRGISGHWRAIDFMLKLAYQGTFKDKILASAHLYFSILKYLPELLSITTTVIIISNRGAIVDKLTKNHPKLNISFIEIGKTDKTQLSDSPDFLELVYKQLPDNMQGTLCLIGAGIWAEIYCSWVKQRGGVGVDIGSGFDLLDGEITRPVHEKLEIDLNETSL